MRKHLCHIACSRHERLICFMVPGAGVEPAYHIVVRDFQS